MDTDLLEHHGIKGMRWGVRRETSEGSNKSVSKSSRGKKIAVGIGVGAVAIGAVTATVVLRKQGKLPIKDVFSDVRTASNRGMKSPVQTTYVRRQTETGAKAVKKMADDALFKKLIKDFDTDLANAHKEQTEWMLRNLKGYNPRLNPYVPKAEIKRLGRGS